MTNTVDRLPWEVHEALLAERLSIIARIIRDTRAEALIGHDSDKGETLWSLGCRGYERTCHSITLAAETYSWLRILKSGPHFVFTIGGVPMRFYRGEPGDYQARWLQRALPELRQQSLAFVSAEQSGWAWRVLYDTGPKGEVIRVAFVEMTEEGHVRNQWDAPLDTSVSVIAPVRKTLAQGIDLPPVEVGLSDESDSEAQAPVHQDREAER